MKIKNKNVFSTIREISEVLSLSNEPEKLANMALDTLARALKIDCCWIQTINERKHKKLLLAAERGFSPEIRQEIASMDMGHSFSKQVIGLGEKIIIPDLSNDGLYGLPSFRATGYKWLVAVPLMTYRAHGILGAASRNRKLLHKDTADLVMVVGGLIAASFSKSMLSRQPYLMKNPSPAQSNEATGDQDTPEERPEAPADREPAENKSHQRNTRRPDGAFNVHARQMENFRRSHL